MPLTKERRPIYCVEFVCKARGAVTAHGLDVAPLQWPDRISPGPKKFGRYVIL